MDTQDINVQITEETNINVTIADTIDINIEIDNIALTIIENQEPWQDVTDSEPLVVNVNEGKKHRVVLTGNRSIDLSGVAEGNVFIIRLEQDGVGSHTVTWFNTIDWAGGTEPSLTITPGKADLFGFICTATDRYDGFVIGRSI